MFGNSIMYACADMTRAQVARLLIVFQGVKNVLVAMLASKNFLLIRPVALIRHCKPHQRIITSNVFVFNSDIPIAPHVPYHAGQNDYRYRSEIKSKTIGLYQITDVTDLY